MAMTPLDEIARQPAFPHTRLGSNGLPECEAESGISRLDYFAAHATVTAEDAFTIWRNECPSAVAFGPDFIVFWARKRVELARDMIAEIERLDRISRATEESTP